MTFEFLTKHPFIYNKLIKKLGYYADALYSFSNKKLKPSTKNNKILVVVAKSHYVETWQTFSSINKSELKKLLSLKKQNKEYSQCIFQIIENKSIDGFDVKTITFEPEVFKNLGINKVLIPETELMRSDSNQIIEAITPKGVLFCSTVGNRTSSAFAQGLVANINTYKLSAGLPADILIKKVSEAAFPEYILQHLTHTPIAQLLNRILVNPKSWINVNKLHWLYGAPLITALVFYIITNSYLAFKINHLENALQDGGTRIQTVLAQKSAIDQVSQLLEQLSSEFSQHKLVYKNWQIIDQLLIAEATITRISSDSGVLIIRGSAASASAVLATIADSQHVQSASFDGPVRSSRGQDVFILNITPKDKEQA